VRRGSQLWCTPVISALGKLRQEDHEFEASCLKNQKTKTTPNPKPKPKTKENNKITAQVLINLYSCATMITIQF
jgi:hypothetical protein